jgi:hypothetical protein
VQSLRKVRAERKNAFKLIWSNYFKLIVATLLGLFVGPPAHKKSGMSKSVALHVVVFNFADLFYP